MLKLLRTVDQLPQAGPIIFLLNLWPRCQHLDSICIFNTQSVRPPMTEGPLKRILVTVSLKHFIGMLSVYKMQIHNTQHWLHWLSGVAKVHLLDLLNIKRETCAPNLDFHLYIYCIDESHLESFLGKSTHYLHINRASYQHAPHLDFDLQKVHIGKKLHWKSTHYLNIIEHHTSMLAPPEHSEKPFFNLKTRMRIYTNQSRTSRRDENF